MSVVMDGVWQCQSRWERNEPVCAWLRMGEKKLGHSLGRWCCDRLLSINPLFASRSDMTKDMLCHE
jgi:hypothetical protein